VGVSPPSRIRHRYSGVADHDLGLHVDPAVLADRRRALVDLPWSALRQVHGADVRVVEAPGAHAGAVGDALVTAVPGAALAVQTADCGSILLDGGHVLGVVHAGWQGLLAGVIEATAEAMSALGGPPVRATLGPVIRPRCYEFDGPGLEQLAGRYGDAVRSRTAWGTPALDLAAGIAAACSGIGVELHDPTGTCTACSPAHWSHRARGDVGRQVLVAWIEP
jgi:copper oxidase (laccase) domain-containing protein